MNVHLNSPLIKTLKNLTQNTWRELSTPLKFGHNVVFVQNGNYGAIAVDNSYYAVSNILSILGLNR